MRDLSQIDVEDWNLDDKDLEKLRQARDKFEQKNPDHPATRRGQEYRKANPAKAKAARK